MALRAGYKGIKKYIADMLNAMSPGDGIATDAEVSDAFDTVVGWNQEDTHDSVEELLSGKVDNSVVAPVEDGEAASQAYAIGEHFIKDGKFCTVIQTIAAEATLTKDTNYVEGSIAEELKETSIQLSNVNSKITIDTDRTLIHRFGKVVTAKVTFTVSEDMGSGMVTLFDVPYSSVTNFFGYVLDFLTYQFISGAYVSGSGHVQLNSGSFTTGNKYMFNVTYIAK